MQVYFSQLGGYGATDARETQTTLPGFEATKSTTISSVDVLMYLPIGGKHATVILARWAYRRYFSRKYMRRNSISVMV